MVVQRGGAKGGHDNTGDSKANGAEVTNSRIIRAIQESHSHKLASINTLLQTVVQSAKTVVKGTDSQRRFNAQFSEFCRASQVGMADLEDAVYRLEQADGVIGNDEEVKGIRTADFIKEIAGFLATQTKALGAQYLEHVGMSAVNSVAKTQQTKAAETKRGPKRGRVESTGQKDVDSRNSPRKRMGVSPSSAPALGPDAPSLSLPPLGKPGRGRGRAPQNQHGPGSLSGIPELSIWLQPWNIPLPNVHGVALDRVTTERPKPVAATEDSSRHPEEVSVFDICTAVTTTEVLNLWEARECLLSAAADRTGPSNPVSTETVFPISTEEDKPKFFPKSNLGTRAWVPTQVMVDLVHHGISSLGMPFKDMV